jgi:phage-related protein
MTLTTNYTFVYNGLTIGAGTPYQIIEVDGLEGVPELRVQDDNRGGNDGAFTGRDFYNGRTISITLNIFGTQGGNSAVGNYNLFQRAYLPQTSGTQSLQFLLSTADTDKVIQGRVRQVKTKVDKDYTMGFIRTQLVFFCPDPRYYENTSNTATLGAPLTATGRTYNRTYNLSYGGGGSSQAVVTNAGYIYTNPVITITGPAINPGVSCLEQGKTLQALVTLNAGDVLVIDLFNKLVTLNGSSVRNLVTAGSQWFVANPGTNTFVLFADAGATASTGGSVVYSSAYI